MTAMVTSGSMSGEGKRSDGLLGESDNERRRSRLAPPALYATAPLLDSTVFQGACGRVLCVHSSGSFHRPAFAEVVLFSMLIAFGKARQHEEKTLDSKSAVTW
jgi:hypothetical protein